MEWKATKQDSGKRLATFLTEKFAGKYSQRQIKRWMESNCCCLNGQVERFASKKVEAGDRITFKESQTISQTVETLYEDPYYKIVNKPAGLLSEDLQPLLIHRIDRDTSGAIILPKSKEAEEKMVELFRQRKIKKQYLAIVDAVPHQTNGIIRNNIGRLHGTLWAVMKDGKPAETEWQLQRTGPNCALLACFPKTGRTHQIRLHLNEIGHPILGDYQYCRTFRSQFRPKRQMLHSSQVSFEHPYTQKTITIHAPLPQDFEEILKGFE